MFSFPTRWYYDVLRALDYFRSTGGGLDERCAQAVDLVAGKRDAQGPLATREHTPGADPFRDGRARRIPQSLEHSSSAAGPPLGGIRGTYGGKPGVGLNPGAG